MKRVRDFAIVKHDGVITCENAMESLNLLEVDALGLDRLDRKILETILNLFNGGPVGLETLATSIGEDAGTIEDVYEPFLLQNGFIAKTPRGRVLTSRAFEHLGISEPASFKERNKNAFENLSIDSLTGGTN